MRDKVLRIGVVWGLMTSLIGSEYDSEKGRVRILRIAQIDYKEYFTSYERRLIEETSKMVKIRSKEERVTPLKYAEDNRKTLQEMYVCEALLKDKISNIDEE